jgi:D-alanyl-D-alanine dipeptidase
MKKKYCLKILLFTSVCFFLIACNTKKEPTETRSLILEKKILEKPALEKTSPFETSMLAQGLVNIQTLDPTVLVDLKYSSEDNFFGEDVYGDFNKGFLQKKPAEELVKASGYLKTIDPNLRLLIYDATRPHSIQNVLWDKLDSLPPKRRKDFVADPAMGSIHSYGCAVDLTLFDMSKQEPLDMGTKYDFFGDLAYPRLENKMLKEGKLSEKQISNRLLLRGIMKKFGYKAITSEWWHFNFYSRAKAKELFRVIK